MSAPAVALAHLLHALTLFAEQQVHKVASRSRRTEQSHRTAVPDQRLHWLDPEASDFAQIDTPERRTRSGLLPRHALRDRRTSRPCEHNSRLSAALTSQRQVPLDAPEVEIAIEAADD